MIEAVYSKSFAEI